MDVQTGLIYVGVVVISAAVILLVSMFGIKEKSYEEAIAEQRKLPDDLLLNKKDKGKERKHKNKAGKKVKEKKEEKDDKDEKVEHVQFEEVPQILTSELPLQESNKGSKKRGKLEKVKPILVNKDEPVVIVPELNSSQPLLTDVNHFDLTQPKDDLELIRSHSRENLHQVSPSEPLANKSPKDTPIKSKKNAKEPTKKKDDNAGKEEKKDSNASGNATLVANKDSAKDGKDQQKETPVKEVKEVSKESVKDVTSAQPINKESKKGKKKNDILAQIGGDKDAVNVSLLILFIQKAELSRSEIQILIDQLLNKQMDNPSEHSEWTEGRADPVIKLKKQLAEKEKALADEHEASTAVQNKLKELRAEFNAERSRMSANIRQLEEALNTKITEVHTLHTRMQHILESHAAEKQGFARQIEQLQSKINEDTAIIHKMQEDQGQTQGHMQQELIAQRKQMEVQFAQVRENESVLKGQLAQKHVEVQELQNELQATCESSTAEIEMLRQQLGMMQGQLMHSEGQLQHFKEASDRMQDVARQLEESHRAHADLDHRLKAAHRHEQELQKQVNALQAELNVAKAEANEATALKAELNKVQSELVKLQSELSASVTEAKTEAAEITALKMAMSKSQEELSTMHTELKKVMGEKSHLEARESSLAKELEMAKAEYTKLVDTLQYTEGAIENKETEIQRLRNDLTQAQAWQVHAIKLEKDNDMLTSQVGTVPELQNQIKQLREENESLASQLAASTERPAAEGRENGIEEKMQKSNIQLAEHTNLLAQKESQLDALKTELIHKEGEINQLNAQVDALRSDVNNQHNIVRRLKDDLEAQRLKNNELRTKNWKVMEALSAAESRAKSFSGKNTNEVTQKTILEQEELTKAFLQRVFPEIRVSEKNHDQWLNAFEEKLSGVMGELKKKAASSANVDLEKQNKHLQGMISHYKQIIDDTEGMLNKLQSHIESEESRWQAQLRQKESEVANLRVELGDLRNKINANDMLQEKVSELEARLAETESLNEQAKAEMLALQATQNSISNVDAHNQLAALEKLQQMLMMEKAQLSEELQTESNKRANLDAEVTKLRSLVETSKSSLKQEKNLVTELQQEVSQLKNEIYGGCSNLDQSMLNGPPPPSDASKTEPSLPAHSLIAALENTLTKKTEFEYSSVPKPVNLVRSEQDIENSPLTSKNFSKSCHMTDHDTQAGWNPLIGQQHKKHKKKRKGGSGKK